MYRVNQYSSPSPRSSRTRWILLGAGVGVLASVGMAGAAFFVVVRRAHLAPPPAIVVGPRAPPPSATSPTNGAPEIADEPPSPPGSPGSSLKARPAWGKLEVGVRGPETLQYAPQHSKPLETFLAALPLGETLEHGFVICRFQSFNKADTFAGDDLHVRARFGTTPEVAADGPEDGNLGFVSAPLVSLKKDATVAFEVYDRDVFNLTPLTKQTTVWRGGPLTIMDSGAAIECRGLGGESLARTVSLDTAKADEAILRVASRELDGHRSDWAYPNIQISVARRAIGNVAALAGWDDARTKKRIASLGAAETRLEEQRPQVFAKLHASARAEASVGALSATLHQVSCDATHATRCAVKVAIANRSDKPVRSGLFGGFSAYMATAESGPVAAAASFDQPAMAEIAPGTSADVTFTASTDVQFDTEASILGLCVESVCEPLKLR